MNAAVSKEQVLVSNIDSVNVEQLSVLERDYARDLIPGKSIKGTMNDTKDGEFVETKRSDLWSVDPRKLRKIPDFNVRVKDAGYRYHVDEIKESIKANGFYPDQPLIGYVAQEGGQDVIFIYDGEHRLDAVMELIAGGMEIARIPVTVKQDGVSLIDMTVGLVRRNGGKALSFYESAVVCKRLIGFGLDVKEISERVGLPVVGVRQRVKLMGAPLRLKAMVASGDIAATLALELLDQHGSEVMEVIDGAQVRAEGAGKTKVRAAQLDATPHAKVARKVSSQLFDAAKTVRQDPGFAGLSEEARTLIETLLDGIEAKAAPKVKAVKEPKAPKAPKAAKEPKAPKSAKAKKADAAE